MIQKLILLFILFLTFSCSEKKAEMPKDILSKEKYISVMVDMYLLESEFNHVNLIDRPTYKKSMEKYISLFKKHKTNKEQVEKSIDHYTHQPNEMKEIQMRILDSLNVKSIK
jgi:hypothetical protein